MPDLTMFEEHNIRRVRHKDDWWFSVIDMIEALDVSENPANYWKVTKHRLALEAGQPVTDCNQFKLPAADGKMRLTDCATAKTIFRIIQSIPSPKAEPLKQWLAKVAVERLEEEANPDLAVDRAIRGYRARGWDNKRIGKRLKSIRVRHELTDEWNERGATDRRHYRDLTATVHVAAFGVTPAQHKHIKGITHNENFRDTFTDMEATLSMLAEEATVEITRERDAIGLPELRDAAQEGGSIAAAARVAIESKLGRRVVTGMRFIPRI